MSITEYASTYRYFVTDLLSNQVIGEIPFKSVTYERAIKGAGKFSGSIPYIPDTVPFDLYSSTMPGKTGLYIVRDGQCVWGGIIWSRSYSVESRVLQVSGAEFTSYFYHRNIWKTYSHSFGATITKASGTTTVSLDLYSFLFPIGSTIQIIFYEVGDFAYNGYYEVLTTPDTSSCTVTIPSLPNGTYLNATVYVRVDTYDYIRQLLDTMAIDYTNIDFPNEEIEPGKSNKIEIATTQVASNVATITTVESHGLLPGQQVAIINTGAPYNGGSHIVLNTANVSTFAFDVVSANVPLTAVSPQVLSITNKQLISAVATLTTATSHGFFAGDTVEVSGVDSPNSSIFSFDGLHVVTNVSSATSFSYSSFALTDVLPQVGSGTVTKTPYAVTSTYGPYPANSDIGIGYSTEEYSGVNVQNRTYRGYQLSSVGEELDKYSDTIDGFEYRIDCEFDAATDSFTRTLVLLAINFPNPPAPGEVSPISRFGADKLVFDYPGSIIEITVDESAENAATRFFVVGNTGDLGQDVSQPYAAATAEDLLYAGWPLLDAEESIDQQTPELTDNAKYIDTASEDTLYKYAKRYLDEFRPPIADIKVSVNGSLSPKVGEYSPGDWCALNIDDEFFRARLASDLEPRDTIIVRKIDSYSVSVPDVPSFPEKVDLNLISEYEVDKRG
jgi:hypothetical protein